MQYIITRTREDITVSTPAGELGFILPPEQPGQVYEAWANLAPKDGFTRALVEKCKTLQDAVAFILAEGVA